MLAFQKLLDIINALRENPNAAQVARQVGGVSVTTVCKIAKAANVKLAAGRPRIAPEKRAEIIAALEVNPNAVHVARRVGGVSFTTVRNIAKAAGIELAAGKTVRGRGRPLAPEKRAEIIAALEANPNAAHVARHVGGVSFVTVWNIAKAAGIELTAGRPRIAPEKRAEIIAALEANPNAAHVARHVGGVSYETVRRIAKAEGIRLAREKPRTNQRLVSRRSP